MNTYFVTSEFCSKIEKITFQTCCKYFNFVEGSRGGLLLTPLPFLSVLPGDLLREKKDPTKGKKSKEGSCKGLCCNYTLKKIQTFKTYITYLLQ